MNFAKEDEHTSINLSPRYPFRTPPKWNMYREGITDAIIDGFLYLGDLECVDTIENYGITHVISLLNRHTFNPDIPEENHLMFDVSDSPDQTLVHVFPAAFSFLEKCKENNQKVLVHCSAGVSRSATVVIAYMMYSHGMTLKQAYLYVKSMRPVIYPNKGFMKQLSNLNFKD